MGKRKRTWLLRPLVLGLAVTAIAASMAQAAPHEGADISGGSGTVYLTPHDWPKWGPSGTVYVTPHDRPMIGPPIRDGQAFQQSENPSSFDWRDASVVAAGLGFVLLLFGAVQARRRTARVATL
jgi:hypothetical protein